MTALGIDKIESKLLDLVKEAGTDGNGWLAGVLAARDLPQWARLAEHANVDVAREDGLSWAAIGRELGMSKQAAWDRYGTSESMEAESDPEQEKPRRRPRPVIKLALSEAEIVGSILEELDSRPAQALSKAIAERIAELEADMAGDEVDPIDRTGFAPERPKAPTPKLAQLLKTGKLVVRSHTASCPRCGQEHMVSDDSDPLANGCLICDWKPGEPTRKPTPPAVCMMSGSPSLFAVGSKNRCPTCHNLVVVRTDGKWSRHQAKPVPDEVVKRSRRTTEPKEDMWTDEAASPAPSTGKRPLPRKKR